MANRKATNSARAVLLASAMTLALAGCGVQQVSRHGYVPDEGALDQIQIGSSREQVELIMGTPSTTATLGDEVYFYISETRKQMLFLKPNVVDRRVLTFYFDNDGRLNRIANFGIQDGKVFDFISRTTPTRGDDLTFLRQIFGNIGNINPFGNR